jgi:hypothetical protein
MNMQSALDKALSIDAYARPVRIQSYSYRYVPHGQLLLIHVSSRDRNGNVRSGVWRTLSKPEMEDDWILCDVDGAEIDPNAKRGPSLSDLAINPF